MPYLLNEKYLSDTLLQATFLLQQSSATTKTAAHDGERHLSMEPARETNLFNYPPGASLLVAFS